VRWNATTHAWSEANVSLVGRVHAVESRNLSQTIGTKKEKAKNAVVRLEMFVGRSLVKFLAHQFSGDKVRSHQGTPKRFRCF
jgi:hypothetical protein